MSIMSYDMEPMLDLFIYETEQQLEKLEELTINAEDEGEFGSESIQDIFRSMHTIKGSAAMMLFDQISTLAHILEDLFDLMRHDKVEVNTKQVADFVLETVDYIKHGLERIQSGEREEKSSEALREKIREYIADITGEERAEKVEPVKSEQYFIPSLSEDESTFQYEVIIWFASDTMMENVRGYTLMNAVQAFAISIDCYPVDLLDEEKSDEVIADIQQNGFHMYIKSNEESQVIRDYLTGYPYVERFEIIESSKKVPEDTTIEILLDDEEQKVVTEDTDKREENESVEPNKKEEKTEDKLPKNKGIDPQPQQKPSTKRKADKMISVHVEKLDRLMDLVGELVVSESMVSRNDVIASLEDASIEKAIQQHRKIINDVQDVAMSIRMVPVSGVFQKMKRLVRDVSNKMDKQIELIILGEQTEVDKNIIDKLSDPLMHLIRNSCDHGIEDAEGRKAAGKFARGRIVLEAKNAGGDVLIIVEDDGKGLDSERIYNKAIENDMISASDPRPTDEELYTYIFKAGFSTKEEVSEYSGRGVGMDVAVKNIERLGGSISVVSEQGKGTRFTIKIPLTLSIIDGMKIRVGSRYFILPITTIQQSFKVEEDQYICDPQDNEMILLRGKAHQLVRLNTTYGIDNALDDVNEGIIIMVGSENNIKAVFADELLGEQQVVVKPLPSYLEHVEGITGCAILGDGGISLILDQEGLFRHK